MARVSGTRAATRSVARSRTASRFVSSTTSARSPSGEIAMERGRAPRPSGIVVSTAGSGADASTSMAPARPARRRDPLGLEARLMIPLASGVNPAVLRSAMSTVAIRRPAAT